MVQWDGGTIGHKIETQKHPRHGTQFVIQYPTNRNTAQSLQENVITVFVPGLYNLLPKYLRDISKVLTGKFKFVLDKFLEFIPDCPKMTNYVTAARCNSIHNQQSYLRAQGIFQGGVPDLAMEQA